MQWNRAVSKPGLSFCQVEGVCSDEVTPPVSWVSDMANVAVSIRARAACGGALGERERRGSRGFREHVCVEVRSFSGDCARSGSR